MSRAVTSILSKPLNTDRELLLPEVERTDIHGGFPCPVRRDFPEKAYRPASRSGSIGSGQGRSAAARSPKIAVPTRTMVAPSSIATSKSWLMPIDSSASAACVDALRNEIVSETTQGGEIGAGVFRVGHRGRQQHQPDHANGRAARRPLRRSATARRRERRAWSLRRPGRLESADRALRPPSAAALSRAVTSSAIVHGVNDVEERGSLARLVGLQVSDEMPAQRQVGGVGDLAFGFLNLVFAEIDLTGWQRRRGRDRRKTSWRRRSGGSRRGRVRPGWRRARCDRERRPAGPGARRNRSLTRYFGSASTNCLAIAAFGPEGDSFR